MVPGHRHPGASLTPPNPRVPPVLVVLAAGLAIRLIDRALPTAPIPAARETALLLAACGVAAIVLGLTRFRRAGTTVDPLSPAKASALVTRGIYRRSRNPMYLGFAVILLAWAVGLSTLPGVIVVPLFVLYMNRFQIGPEERALDAVFGEEYRAYRQRVRRWL